MGLFIHTNAWQRLAPERSLLYKQTCLWGDVKIRLSEMTKRLLVGTTPELSLENSWKGYRRWMLEMLALGFERPTKRRITLSQADREGRWRVCLTHLQPLLLLVSTCLRSNQSKWNHKIESARWSWWSWGSQRRRSVGKKSSILWLHGPADFDLPLTSFSTSTLQFLTHSRGYFTWRRPGACLTWHFQDTKTLKSDGVRYTNCGFYYHYRKTHLD